MKIRILEIRDGDGSRFYAQRKTWYGWAYLKALKYHRVYASIWGYRKADVEAAAAKWLLDHNPKIREVAAYEDWELVRLKEEKEHEDKKTQDALDRAHRNSYSASLAIKQAVRDIAVCRPPCCTSGKCKKPCVSC